MARGSADDKAPAGMLVSTRDQLYVETRLRRTRLSNMRQELLAPANAIMGYGDMLLEEARSQSLVDVVPDLERIVTAARDLLELIDRSLDVGTIATTDTPRNLADMQSTLRHDLRNPLNAIKGYGEDVDGTFTMAGEGALTVINGSLTATRIDILGSTVNGDGTINGDVAHALGSVNAGTSMVSF
jgi:signal transduction histidine kinase